MVPDETFAPTGTGGIEDAASQSSGPGSGKTVAGTAVAAMGVVASLTACAPAVLDPRGPVGRTELVLLLDSLAIMLAVVVPTILATLAVAWWYRASNPRAKRRPDWSFSSRVEIVVWGIPLLVIMLLGGVIWVGSHVLDPAREIEAEVPPLDVQVVSLDWKWLFIYPGQKVASVNRLVVPAGVPLRLSLTSASVMNAFFVPQLGSMIYTMNGMTSRLNLRADAPGTFRGLSSHYSGDGFAGMHFEVEALPAAGFQQWMNAVRTSGPVLDAATYTHLANPGWAAPATYRDVDEHLFEQIAMAVLPAGPGPATSPSGSRQIGAALR